MIFIYEIFAGKTLDKLFLYDCRIMADVLEANNFPGSICSMICGGADVG